MIYSNFIEKMNEYNLPYLVVGGIAVNLHGYLRSTLDLDLLILLDESNTEKFVRIVNELGFKPVVPVAIQDFNNPEKRDEWLNSRNMKAFSVYNDKNPIEHVDVLIDNTIDFKGFYSRRVTIDGGGIEISLISIDDLIQLKKAAARPRDLIDIKALERIRELKNGQK